MKYIILDNIRSAYNVGAIFRTADGAGCDSVFLCGYTPTPIDRFGRRQTEIEKTSLGASSSLPWETHVSAVDLIKQLQAKGVTVVACEQSPNSISLTEFTEPAQVAYVVGNEVDGVQPEVLDIVDILVEIPMLGHKESLNVSVSAGIILYNGIT